MQNFLEIGFEILYGLSTYAKILTFDIVLWKLWELKLKNFHTLLGRYADPRPHLHETLVNYIKTFSISSKTTKY